MARIVDDLILLAKAERPDFVQLGPVELADLTTELLAKARALGDREWTLDACATGVVEADAQRLTQAVLNLARNAVEHTAAGDTIAIGSRCSHGELRIWVRDTGAGIEFADQTRIFERFSRGGGAQRRSDGAGLGLAIVQAVATSHRGRVVLESRPGAGATFTIVLPGTPADAVPTDELPVSEEATWPGS
jgi:signal transduction histidine kinase